MVKVFMEYKIIEEHRENYLQAMKKVAESMKEQQVSHFQYFEGADQPLLFVEMFDVDSMDEYERLKAWRCGEDSVISNWIQGGNGKIHMWAFKEITE